MLYEETPGGGLKTLLVDLEGGSVGGPDKKLVSVGTRRLNMAVVALKIAFLLHVSSSAADIVVISCD